MFKNASIYKIHLPQPMLVATLENQLQAHTFEPCGPSQHHAFGWVPPRGEAHGALVEHINGQLIMMLRIETKSVPTQIIQKWVAEQVATIEHNTGRKPGRKEKKDLKEQATLALLPGAFPRSTSVTLWIDPEAGRLVLDTTSAAQVDDAITALVKAIDGVKFDTFSTTTSPSVAMATWLSEQEAPAGFSIGKACELKAADESRAVVRYARHPILTDEVKAHLAQGKQPTRLALEWDDRVAFTLTDGLQLTGIEFQDAAVLENKKHAAQDAFDANVMIATAELTSLIGGLTQALDGEAESAASSSRTSPGAA